ncbi:hypothetical protein RvY_03225 [Ramazzottius varieornatus]|uniref:Uncharacterized protein n=1 Tax=Ramazzottius varieornatus TaxID=947166 RepID=A0A1D1UMB8_RAMVA|nr:hypothetical protein RvY_03225 [Ramazzottius varieornatus]
MARLAFPVWGLLILFLCDQLVMSSVMRRPAASVESRPAAADADIADSQLQRQSATFSVPYAQHPQYRPGLQWSPPRPTHPGTYFCACTIYTMYCC